MRAKRFLGIAGLLLFGTGVAAGVYLWRLRLPAPTGPSPVGTTILDMTDGSRPLVVQLWYPAANASGPLAPYRRWRETALLQSYLALLRTDAHLKAPIAQSGAPFPVLLFGHRWGGEHTQNTSLAEDLASHGFVVAAIDHPGNSARMLLPDGRVLRRSESMDGPEPGLAEARVRWWNRTLEVWAKDEVYVLDRLAARSANPSDPFFRRLDTQHAGAFGHSFGGAAALRLCGRDPRIRGAVNLDGYTFGALSDRTAAQPILILYEQSVAEQAKRLRHEALPGSVDDQLAREDNASVEASLTRFGGDRVYLAGTQHGDFTDEPLLPLHRPGDTGPITPGRANALTRTLVLGFFDHVLRGGPPQDLSQEAMPERLAGPGPLPGALGVRGAATQAGTC